ncbi:VOC family protein [Youhaiella tibetensis]|uniref:VOC family protein n=1 Tax=Paradevosia tibetensis TaxID=1447062 RepID=A0A5B9DQN9_9HYPH|nr:VOC family protein [Youhaiella tibetensis]QEE21740.1 VOC family protein [Youhaiella tibetensis]GGF12073.1 VOC family protein [Youhaiella tibetensis]
MAIKTVTHLNFRGEARAALAFYHAVFGGKLAALTYRDAQAVQDESEADQIMWGEVASDAGFHIMAYDVPGRLDWNRGEIPFFVSVRGDAAEEISGYWEKLREGGTTIQPLGPAGWSPLYGMVRDRFGVTWVLDVAAAG